MTEFDLSETAEEVLASLWVAEEESDEHSLSLEDLSPSESEEALRELSDAGLASGSSGRLTLTEAGRKAARSIIRRERLAERLLADVLNVGDAVVTEAACKFEHLLRKGIDDEICTLLGHPKVCPHGNPIPPGECCREGARAARTVVSALADMSPRQAGVIAYIHARRRPMLQRLLAMGAVPGAPVMLLQRFPSFVFQLGQGQVAVDRETARDIYVRITGKRPPAQPPLSFSPRARGFRFRRGRRDRS